MPRHPDTAVEPNRRLQEARRRLPSPLRPGKCMSRSEFVTAVNGRLHADGVLDADIDYDYVVKLEAGKHHWPRDGRRRSAIRAVLRVRDDAEIGFHRERRSRADEAAPDAMSLGASIEACAVLDGGESSSGWPRELGGGEEDLEAPHVRRRSLLRGLAVVTAAAGIISAGHGPRRRIGPTDVSRLTALISLYRSADQEFGGGSLEIGRASC